jgi:hypothetical protein
MSEQPSLSPRDALRFILIRYDYDAGMAPGVWAVVLKLQEHLSWVQHINRAREKDRARATAIARNTQPLDSRTQPQGCPASILRK